MRLYSPLLFTPFFDFHGRVLRRAAPQGRACSARLCHFALRQDTDGHDRVVARMRHGPLGLTLGMPDDDEPLA